MSLVNYMNKSEKLLQQVKDGYNQIADHFSKTRYAPWSEFELFNEYIKDNQKILDLGCGNGRLFFTVLKDFNIEYHGIDNSERLIEIAKKKIFNYQLPITNQFSSFNFQVSNITDLPYPDNYFDLVFCVAAFHHLPTKKLRLKALSEIKRVLKPGGYLLMTNWHLWHRPFWKYFFSDIFKKVSIKDFFFPWKSADGQIQCQRYYHAFTKGELKRLFKKIGFKTEKIFLHQNSHKKEYGRGIDIISIVKKI